MQVEQHAGIHCPGTELVWFITSRWDAREWQKHKDAFAAMKAHVVILLDCSGQLIPILY